MILADFPPCDCNAEHVATIHCPECEENFCPDCDTLIHARKKNKEHTREPIQVVEPEPEPEPVPCDSNPAHEAVMYCEDCEENFCSECDFTFHSRKKTANHLRYEGARRPEVVEALKRETEAEAAQAEAAAAQQMEEMRIAEEKQKQQQTQRSATSASPVNAAGKKEIASQRPATASSPAAGAAAARPASASTTAAKSPAVKATNTATAPKSITPARPTAAGAGATGAVKKATSAGKKASKKNASSSPAPRDPMTDHVKDSPSSKDRVSEHKAAWNDLRLQYCKKTYNVGHWLGLTTDERKELAVTLCKELLFNPPCTVTDDSAVDVTWNAVSYWTTYEVDIECIKTVSDTHSSNKSVTTYKVHIDDNGRLADFEIVTDGIAAAGCNIM